MNDWVTRALERVDTVLDVGANDGYFTFGCAAAFRRVGKAGRIVAFEPQAVHCEQLKSTMALQDAAGGSVTISIEQAFVGRGTADGQTTLDAQTSRAGQPLEPRRALVKIDVEGAKIDVIEGASCWLDRSNYFLIEVHRESYLEALQTRFASVGPSPATGRPTTPSLAGPGTAVNDELVVGHTPGLGASLHARTRVPHEFRLDIIPGVPQGARR